MIAPSDGLDRVRLYPKAQLSIAPPATTIKHVRTSNFVGLGLLINWYDFCLVLLQLFDMRIISLKSLAPDARTFRRLLYACVGIFSILVYSTGVLLNFWVHLFPGSLGTAISFLYFKPYVEPAGYVAPNPCSGSISELPPRISPSKSFSCPPTIKPIFTVPISPLEPTLIQVIIPIGGFGWDPWVCIVSFFSFAFDSDNLMV
jgi:hypothetical protein